MAAQCRNYMQQYSRTKSIRQINKTRNSYKQLLQNSKTRQNSTTTTNLKISDKKRSSQKQKQKLANKNTEQFQIENCSSVVEQMKASNNNQNMPLLSSTQNISSIINISYGKLNSKMKLKVTADKNIRSMSSQEQLLKYQNSVVVSSMADIGVGLSNKKKPKLVTLTSCQNPNNSTTKKYKHYNQLTSISQHDNQHSHSNHKQHEYDKSRSKSKSHNNSVANSKYGTHVGHQAVYRSIKKEVENHNNVDIITLNSSMLMSKDRRDSKADGLDLVYQRVKVVLQSNQQRQKQWQQQRTYYQTKIKQLEKQLSQANKRNSIMHKPIRPENYSNYNSIIKQELPVKSSNRNNFN